MEEDVCTSDNVSSARRKSSDATVKTTRACIKMFRLSTDSFLLFCNALLYVNSYPKVSAGPEVPIKLTLTLIIKHVLEEPS